jgi:hypothetical protein
MIFQLFLDFEKKAEAKKAFEVPRETIRERAIIERKSSRNF